MGPDLLSRDHGEVDVLLDAALNKLASANPAEAFSSIDMFWARLAMHIRAEHLHLFPALLNSSGRDELSDTPETIERLRADHDFFMHELAEIIKTTRSATTGVETQIIPRLEEIKSRLEHHNAIEEEKIYPLRRLLSVSESEQLDRLIEKELRNLPPRFAKDA